MKKYVVLTDSTCDIPEEIAQKHGIDILSFTVILDGKEYDERRDLDPDQFYKLLDEAEGMPTTAQITSITFAETFERYDAEGVEELLYVSINSTAAALTAMLSLPHSNTPKSTRFQAEDLYR